MKVLKDKYPKGTWKYQKTDGRYVDALLHQNLRLLATKIVKDMTFLGIGFSSTLEVGTGKSVLFSQIGEIWGELMKEIHNIDVPFTQKNIVFRPEELIERAFEVPQYSCILLDEWEDAHYWSGLGMTLRKFFRKCRQLNLFILVIIPNFFQLPLGYAISRSIFAIDVKFDDSLERGGYDFYGFKSKKKLFIKGRKFHDYNVQAADFNGEFFDGYGVPEKEYRRVKRLDMEKYDDEDKTIVPAKAIYEIESKVIKQIHDYCKENKVEFNQKQMGSAIGKSQQAISYMIKKDLGTITKEIAPQIPTTTTYKKLQDNKPSVVGEGEEGQ
jgi:hypothetical protein